MPTQAAVDGAQRRAGVLAPCDTAFKRTFPAPRHPLLEAAPPHPHAHVRLSHSGLETELGNAGPADQQDAVQQDGDRGLEQRRERQRQRCRLRLYAHHDELAAVSAQAPAAQLCTLAPAVNYSGTPCHISHAWFGQEGAQGMISPISPPAALDHARVAATRAGSETDECASAPAADVGTGPGGELDGDTAAWGAVDALVQAERADRCLADEEDEEPKPRHASPVPMASDADSHQRDCGQEPDVASPCTPIAVSRLRQASPVPCDSEDSLLSLTPQSQAACEARGRAGASRSRRDSAEPAHAAKACSDGQPRGAPRSDAVTVSEGSTEAARQAYADRDSHGDGKLPAWASYGVRGRHEARLLPKRDTSVASASQGEQGRPPRPPTRPATMSQHESRRQQSSPSLRQLHHKSSSALGVARLTATTDPTAMTLTDGLSSQWPRPRLGHDHILRDATAMLPEDAIGTPESMTTLRQWPSRAQAPPVIQHDLNQFKRADAPPRPRTPRGGRGGLAAPGVPGEEGGQMPESAGAEDWRPALPSCDCPQLSTSVTSLPALSRSSSAAPWRQETGSRDTCHALSSERRVLWGAWRDADQAPRRSTSTRWQSDADHASPRWLAPADALTGTQNARDEDDAPLSDSDDTLELSHGSISYVGVSEVGTRAVVPSCSMSYMGISDVATRPTAPSYCALRERFFPSEGSVQPLDVAPCLWTDIHAQPLTGGPSKPELNPLSKL